MKSIIRNRNKYIFKNNKAHYLHYSSFQEDIYHYKKHSYRFQGKSHYYYRYYYTKRYYNFYYFNDMCIYL
jgi:hypothetical protein